MGLTRHNVLGYGRAAVPRNRPSNWYKLGEAKKLQLVFDEEQAELPARYKPGRRRCQACRGWFQSEWCGNRRCLPCRTAE